MIDSVHLKATQPTNHAVDTASKSQRQVAGVDASALEDRVSISGTAKMVMAMLADDQIHSSDMERIQQLKSAIEAGTYQVDSQKIADKIIRETEEV